MRPLLDYRSEFPILEHTTYLINHSLGAMPAKVEERVAEYARTWRERGIRAWGEGWWEMPMTVGDQIGRIVGAPAGSTVMHQNVAIAEAVVLSASRPSPQRNRIVYERGNFPSVRYLYQAQRDLEVVVCEDDGEIVEAIDERTLLVPISHVLYKSGEIQDVEKIVSRAHDVGAHVILDAYQSAGIVPLDVAVLDVDFAVGGSVKWLCGGPGNGWLYVRPDLAERLEPTYTGWQAHEAPFAFEEEMRYASGAARFLTGTPNVPALYAGTPGYDLIEEIGVERIRENSLRQTELLIRLAETAGFGIASARDPERRGGTVTVHVDEFPAVHKELSERADPLRLPPRRGHPDRAALLHLGRRARARGRADHGDRRDGSIPAPHRRRRAGTSGAAPRSRPRRPRAGLRRPRSPSARASARAGPC